jgi:hypothetical protein
MLALLFANLKHEPPAYLPLAGGETLLMAAEPNGKVMSAKMSPGHAYETADPEESKILNSYEPFKNRITRVR